MLPEQKILDRLNSDEILHRLAQAEHERWAHWQKYMHEQCERQPDGSLLIPAELVSRWTRQIETVYADLNSDEQKSDQEQVRRYLPLILEAVANSWP